MDGWGKLGVSAVQIGHGIMGKSYEFLVEKWENWRARGHLVNRIGGEIFFKSLWQLDLGENEKITKNGIF